MKATAIMRLVMRAGRWNRGLSSKCPTTGEGGERERKSEEKLLLQMSMFLSPT